MEQLAHLCSKFLFTISRSYARHTPKTVAPCSLHSIAPPLATIATLSWKTKRLKKEGEKKIEASYIKEDRGKLYKRR